MEILFDIANVAIYSVLGIALMILGNFVIDLFIPCHFPTEIKKGNQAVAWLSAGSFIGIGMILKAVIQSGHEVVEETLLAGLGSSILYFVVGIVFFVLGYFVVDIVNKQYKLSEEIGNGNTAAGIFVFGIFAGLALVISGALM